LTSSTAWSNLEPLFEEAIWAASLYPRVRRCHLDVGSGGGFPAIPLAILNPETGVELVEARERRAAFLETVAAELRLPNVTVHARRLDALLAAQPEKSWDAVSWKAIRLERDDLEQMLRRRPSELWVFHGRSLSADEADILTSHELAERRSVPGRASSHLSIYRLRSAPDSSIPGGSGRR